MSPEDGSLHRPTIMTKEKSEITENKTMNNKQLDKKLLREFKVFGISQTASLIAKVRELFEQAGYRKSQTNKQSELDLDRLKVEIKEMRYHHPIFKVLRDSLTERGYWRAHPRGNPKLGWAKSHGKKEE